MFDRFRLSLTGLFSWVQCYFRLFRYMDRTVKYFCYNCSCTHLCPLYSTPSLVEKCRNPLNENKLFLCLCFHILFLALFYGEMGHEVSII